MTTYHPYWTMEGGYRHKNPRFDEYSNMILNLKNRSPWAIRYFYRILEPLADKDTVIIVVKMKVLRMPMVKEKTGLSKAMIYTAARVLDKKENGEFFTT